DRSVAGDVAARRTALAQIGHPAASALHQLLDRAELDRVGRTRLGAGRLQPILKPVVAQRTLVGLAISRADLDDTVRAGRHAVAAAVANVLLDDHGVELGADDRPGRTRLHAAGVDAVL